LPTPRRVARAYRTLDLPPVYRLVTLREGGDAFEHACSIAAEAGAGTLVWTRRFDVAEFAVVLEPEEPLATARQAFYLCMNALGDALSTHAPPQRPVTFDWPDGLRVDGVLVGGGRLGCPPVEESQAPPWLVFSAIVRTAVIRAGETGLRPLLGALNELGFEEIDAGEIIASFARHLMAGFHDREENGFAPIAKRWLERLDPAQAPCQSLDALGDCSGRRGDAGGTEDRRSLKQALATPSWRDPATGMPWL
jgi:hypothetical protein